MTNGLAFVRGKFVSLDKAMVPIVDLGFQRGYGITDVLRSYGTGRPPLALAEHLERIKSSAKIIGLASPSMSFIRHKVLSGLRRVKGETLVKVIITGGDGHYLVPDGKPQLYILFTPHVSFPAWYYEKGIKLRTARMTRVLPKGKYMDYLQAVSEHAAALRDRYQAALSLDPKNNILEGTTFNFAVVVGNKLITPEKNVLDGITMSITLKLARKVGLKVSRDDLSYRTLRKADEAFITSTNRELVPVIRVDKTKIGAGQPGIWTRVLSQEFKKYAQKQN